MNEQLIVQQAACELFLKIKHDSTILKELLLSRNDIKVTIIVSLGLNKEI